MFRVFAATLPLLGLSLTSRDLSALELGWPWVGDGHCDPPCRAICSHQGCERLSPRLVGLLNPQVANQGRADPLGGLFKVESKSRVIHTVIVFFSPESIRAAVVGANELRGYSVNGAVGRWSV